MNATSWSWWILLSCACWVFIRRYRTVWYDVCLVLACAVIFASCPAHCLCHNSDWRSHFCSLSKLHGTTWCPNIMPLTSVSTGAGHVGEHQSGRCCHDTQKGQREVRLKANGWFRFCFCEGWEHPRHTFFWREIHLVTSDVSLTYLIAQHWWQIPL